MVERYENNLVCLMTKLNLRMTTTLSFGSLNDLVLSLCDFTLPNAKVDEMGNWLKSTWIQNIDVTKETLNSDVGSQMEELLKILSFVKHDPELVDTFVRWKRSHRFFVKSSYDSLQKCATWKLRWKKIGREGC